MNVHGGQARRAVSSIRLALRQLIKCVPVTMTLAPASRLGAYEVLSALGAGGMGEVYRARDTRLGRDVAIKVLPAERLADEHRRRRFHQEARALSSLNHPHIVTIYEVESAGDVDFIVMEFVRGNTLDQLIPSRGMPVSQLLRIAVPVAEALAAAHARGIIHRDVKPANVMVGDDGVVKVLDFGLAKLLEPDGEPGAATATDLPAGDVSAFRHIAGTPAYMAPEQATGGKVDARSDVFSFGAVLYEMATGARAFDGKSSAETLAAVLAGQPKPPTRDRRRATGTGAGDSALSAQGSGPPLSGDARRPQRSAGARRRGRVAKLREAGPARAALVHGGRRAWNCCRRGGRRVVALEPHGHPITADAGPVGDRSRRL